MKIIKTHYSEHDAKRLYEAWISPESIIAPINKIEVDPVVGGDYLLFAQAPEMTMTMRGKFREVIAGKRLKYSWHWEGTEETTMITVEFVEQPDASGTYIHLEHEGFLTEESRKNHDEGWDRYFAGLDQLLND